MLREVKRSANYYSQRWRTDPDYRARKIANNRRWLIKRGLPYMMFCGARQRARAVRVPFNITVADIVIPKVCPILGCRLKRFGRYRATLDRINPKRGYVRGNIAVISWEANRLKSNATLSQLRAIVAYMERA